MQTKLREAEIEVNEPKVEINEIHIEEVLTEQRNDIPQIIMKQGIYCRYIKRILDVVLSLIALIVLSPVLIIVAVLVRIKLGSPIIFKQRRPGKDEKIFTMYKFRTMTDERDENGVLLSDEVRLAKFGKFLRSVSLDELPELINIVKGDMSIVGPRPLLVEYLPLYNEEQKHRHDAAPGLTGLAQVNGRNLVEWEDKFKYDIEYIRNITLMHDVKIIWQTIKIVVNKVGISSDSNVTMEKFERTKSVLINELSNNILIIEENSANVEEYTNVG